jgi:hypothetical protein
MKIGIIQELVKVLNISDTRHLTALAEIFDELACGEHPDMYS